MPKTIRTLKVAGIFLPPWDPSFPSYSIAIFKALTKKAGHEFFDFDLNIDLFRTSFEKDKKLWSAQFANLWSVDPDNIIQEYSSYLDGYINSIIKREPDLYALSVMCSCSLTLAFYIAERIKERDPDALIIMGGSPCFPNYDPDLYILKNRNIDAVCTGEGDFIWTKVLEHLERNNNLQININGICYKDNDGNIINNGIPDVVRDLNSMSFADYSDIDFAKYGNNYKFSIITSRGCINSCAFCGDRILYPKYRFRSAESIFNEIVKLMDDFYKNPSVPSNRNIIPYISFNDLLINGVIKEFELFCDLLINSGLKVRWGGMALIRKEMTADLLAKMKKAGCELLNWGLESGSQEVLDLMQKKFCTIEMATQVIKRTHETGINQSISLISGFPGETEEMFLKTKEFLSANKNYVSVGIQPMMIVQNTTVSDNLDAFGIAAGANSLTWQTIDGTNTYEIRKNRVEIISRILEGKLMTIDK